MDYPHKELTEKIISCFYKVYNNLGYGFLEKVYENAMMIELRELKLSAIAQQKIEVIYKEQIIGVYYSDILVENKVILELKSAENISDAHDAQLYNYLKASAIEIGLIFNFGPFPTIRRKIYTNDRK